LRENKVNKFLCIIGKIYEGFFGKFADHHLVVSKALKTDLSHKFGISKNKIRVLYDRAVAGKFS
jgi:hypothetical protein